MSRGKMPPLRALMTSPAITNSPAASVIQKASAERVE